MGLFSSKETRKNKALEHLKSMLLESEILEDAYSDTSFTYLGITDKRIILRTKILKSEDIVSIPLRFITQVSLRKSMSVYSVIIDSKENSGNYVCKDEAEAKNIYNTILSKVL